MLKKIQTSSLSVILLMYNEAANIREVLDDHVACLCSQNIDFEIIVINDGSTDDSADIVINYAKHEPRINIINHKQNMGMGAGMSTGITAANKEYLVFNAADGQIAASQINKMIPLLNNADIVLTTYKNSRGSFKRDFFSFAFRKYINFIAQINFKMEGLYLFPTVYAKQFKPLIKSNTFFFSFELIQRGIDIGLKTSLTQIRYKERTCGTSKILGIKRISKVAKEAFIFGISKHLKNYLEK